jgi:Ni/Fe-hydrogenase 1 B-type cytochrome subunit
LRPAEPRSPAIAARHDTAFGGAGLSFDVAAAFWFLRPAAAGEFYPIGAIMPEQIRRVAVWSGWMRLAHWCLGAATLLLLATGWLIGNSPAVAQSAADMHYLAAGLLVFALGLRLFLGLFGKAAEHFEHLVPRTSEWAAMRASLLFYLSLGKAPLPNWFAHNPLWKPLYLLLFVLFALLALSGWLMPDVPLVGRLYLPRLHGWLADAVAVVTLAHLCSVVLQDLKGQSADISAMISGYRYFRVDREVRPEVPQVSVRLDDVGRRRGSER